MYYQLFRWIRDFLTGNTLGKPLFTILPFLFIGVLYRLMGKNEKWKTAESDRIKLVILGILVVVTLIFAELKLVGIVAVFFSMAFFEAIATQIPSRRKKLVMSAIILFVLLMVMVFLKTV